MTVTISRVSEGRGVLALRIDGVASIANAGQGAFANPEGVDLLILRGTLVVHAPSTGAANISLGIAADAVSAATDLIDALAMNGVAPQTAYNCQAMQNGDKTAIAAPALWTAAKYLTITGSASLVGLEATLFLEYLRVNETVAAASA